MTINIVECVSTIGEYTTAISYDVSNNPEYVGIALIGSSKASAVWQIKKITWDVSNNATDIQYADSNANFDNIWNNRTTYIYG